MQALDTTIANIALPYIQAASRPARTRINWVLTAYIVARDHDPTTDPCGRFGRKRLFLVASRWLHARSMLCGMRNPWCKIVLFRVLQGVFAERRWSLCRNRTARTYIRKTQGFAMALGHRCHGRSVLARSLVAGLTESYTWRWVFYINLPIGAPPSSAITSFLQNRSRHRLRSGLVGLWHLESLASAPWQFCSTAASNSTGSAPAKILIEADRRAAAAFYVFFVHTFTADDPFVRPALFRDRNFAAGMAFSSLLA